MHNQRTNFFRKTVMSIHKAIIGKFVSVPSVRMQDNSQFWTSFDDFYLKRLEQKVIRLFCGFCIIIDWLNDWPIGAGSWWSDVDGRADRQVLRQHDVDVQRQIFDQQDVHQTRHWQHRQQPGRIHSFRHHYATLAPFPSSAVFISD